MKGSRKTALRFAAIAVIAMAQGLTSVARASVLLYEGFDMGATAGSLTAGATSSGFAPSSTWHDYSNGNAPASDQASVTYQTAGLMFTTMPVVGGSAVLATPASSNRRADASRQLGFSATGTIYGSYLVNLAAAGPGATQDITSIIVGDSSNYGANDTADAFSSTFQMEVNADGFNTEPSTGGFGAGRIHGNIAGDHNFSNGGVVLSEGTTYLVIFKMTGLGAIAQPQTLTEWILTAAQYDNFVPGGFTESQLNGATLGTGSTNVQQRGTVSTTFPPGDNAQLLSSYYMHLFGAVSANSTIDELRISDSSIYQAAAVPEPASLTLAGLGTVGLLRRRSRRLSA